MPVLVHNADGVNPYGTEIASILARRGHAVTLVDASNSVHEPPVGVTWRRLLPANFGPRTKVGQLRRLARGLSTSLACGLRGDTVLVSSVQFTAENIALAALAGLGRPVVLVQHDPVRRRAESRLSAWARRQILLRSTVAVVHAERLRGEVEAAARDHTVVCPHPPYATTVPVAPPAEPVDPDGRRWLAFIGNLRRDKGIDLVPEILARVPEPERRRLGLVVCGRGSLEPDVWQHLRDLGVVVRDMTSTEPVPQEALLAVLAERPLLLAPYVAATQSGSVILGLTMGCRVLAFDKGGIPDVLTDDGLVPNGDLDAFAAAVALGRGGTSRLPVPQWVDAASEAWSGAVTLAEARARHRPVRPRPAPEPERGG